MLLNLLLILICYKRNNVALVKVRLQNQERSEISTLLSAEPAKRKICIMEGCSNIVQRRGLCIYIHHLMNPREEYVYNTNSQPVVWVNIIYHDRTSVSAGCNT